MSKVLTLTTSDAGVVSIAAQAEATLSDIAATVVSKDKVLTGAYGLLQRAALVETGIIIGGMSAGRSFTSAATLGRMN